MRPVKGRKKLFLLTSALLLILVVLGSTGVLAPIEAFTHQAFAPFTAPLRKATTTVSDLIRSVGLVGRLSGDTKRLEEELAAARAAVAELEGVKNENKELRSQLSAAVSKDFALLPAGIIAQDANSFNQSILINAGEEDGVKIGQTVIYQSILIGQVIETWGSSARVILLTNVNSKIPGATLRSNSTGLIKGELGAGYILFDQIDQASDVKEGDAVVASAQDGNSPKGLLVGFIERIADQPNRPLKTAELRPAVDVSRLSTVFVVTARKR